MCRTWAFGAVALAALAFSPIPGKGDIISGVTAYGWPQERTSGNPPADAVDGDLDSFTWVTESGNGLSWAYIGLDFGQVTNVNRIRLWKDDAAGYPTSLDEKDLWIRYTNDPVTTPLKFRSFSFVSGLTNGYMGSELMVAASVNSNGTVDGEAHDSVNEGHGWASLTFDTVSATGVAIRFAGPYIHLHYKVHEFQALDGAVPEPSTLAALTGLLGMGLIGRSWRRRRKAA